MSAYQEDLKQLCLQLYDIDALKFGDFVTKVGIKTPVYMDMRGIISYPELMVSRECNVHQPQVDRTEFLWTNL